MTDMYVKFHLSDFGFEAASSPVDILRYLPVIPKPGLLVPRTMLRLRSAVPRSVAKRLAAAAGTAAVRKMSSLLKVTSSCFKLAQGTSNDFDMFAGGLQGPKLRYEDR
jgi:hypothetical protein